MIATFTFHYGFNVEGNDAYISKDQWTELRALIPGLVEDATAVQSWHEFTGDIEAVARIIGRFEVKKVHQDLGLRGLLERVERQLREVPKNTFNEKCNVHVPGFGLLAITHLKIQEDCCTDKIQDLLQEGWRIIAVCPQPDQRRPDYVLGRSSEP